MIQRALDTVVVCAGAVVLFILAAGGIDLAAGPIHLRVHDWVRPAVVLVLALLLRGFRPLPNLVRGLSPLACLALVLAACLFYVHQYVPVAGGLDSYGYVSAARLLRSGHLSEPQRLVSLLPFENASTAAAPLGYVPGPDGKTSVPRFPLGLPMVMAAFSIFGAGASFYATLAMSFALIALGYLMGRLPLEPHASFSGLVCAALMAVSPLMFVYSTQPMSDVPAACWLLGAVFLMTGERRHPTAAGICAGMAILTRPALLVAAGVVGLVTIERRFGDTVKYLMLLTTFVLVQMYLNLTMYGHPAASGYGPAGYMFELSVTRVSANAANFGKWLTYSHSLLIWLAWPAALAVLRRERWAWQLSAVAAAALLPYFFYLVFDDWESPRFILPAILIVFVLVARALRRSIPHTATAQLLITILVFGAAAASFRFLDRHSAFSYGVGEAKYPLTGEWLVAHTSERAVVLAGLHSGSIRFYANRDTIRWDQMPSGSLAATIRSLSAAGYEPYLVIDTASEPPLFAERFKSEPGVKLEQVARVRVVNIYRFLSAS